jgi:hypothetical protein
MCIEQFFNNASVGSFFGAFFAFILVVITDRRRNNIKKKQVIKLIQLNVIIINDKIKRINQHKDNIDKKGHLYPGEMLHFQTEEIRALSLQVIDLFKPNEKLALDSICHHMKSVDDLLDEVNNLVNQFIKLGTEIKKENINGKTKESLEKLAKINVEIEDIIKTIKTRYEESLINLVNLIKTTEYYIKGEFNKILNTL